MAARHAARYRRGLPPATKPERKPPGRPAMSDAAVDDIVALLPPLLTSIDALAFVARYLNPPDFDAVLEAAGAPDDALRAVRARLGDWPERLKARARGAGGGERRGARRLRRPARRRRSIRKAFAPPTARCATRRGRRRRSIRWPPTCRRSASSFSMPPCATTRTCRRASMARSRRGHRRHACRQRARQPRRLLDVRAGILHARIAPGRW